MDEVAHTSRIYRQWPWLKGYNRAGFTNDFVAAVIVTVLLVPQCLAYAMLADLPPIVGVYASILPLLAYAAFGSSRFISVGPTAVISLMTAAAIAMIPEESRLVGAALMALLSGVILIVMGLLKSGFIMNFVSRSVVGAYITGAALLIMISQLKHILGVEAGGTTAYAMIKSLVPGLSNVNVMAILVGLACITLFWFSRNYLAYGLVKSGMRSKRAKMIARMFPILVIASSILVSHIGRLADNYDLNVVGIIPSGLPRISIPMPGDGSWDSYLELLQLLWLPALVLALVAFVDSMSTAQTLAAKSRSRINADKEMLAMGASNFVAGLSAGYPVNGSMSRSVVSFSAGAVSPISGVIVAVLMAISALFLTPVLKHLPLATLAALIIAACFSLFDFKGMWQTFRYSRSDGIIAILTFLGVLVFGVQWGVLIGVVLSMTLHIRTTLRPNMALVGRFPGTDHYRDASRFNVETFDEVKTLRIDESLYYANARYLEDKIARVVQQNPKMTDLILMCPAVNRIDASAISSLLTINERLKSADVDLHFSELHTYLKERLMKSDLIESLTGQIYFSQKEAMEDLEPDPDWSQYSDHVDIH